MYTKYLLWKTGLFPKMEPSLEDIVYVAMCSDEIKDVITPNGHRYYYVIPMNYNIRSLCDLVRTFRANGVILRPHRSHNYNSVVFRVPNRGQRFMRDAMRVNKSVDNFQKILSERNIDMSPLEVQNMVKCVMQKNR